MLMKKTIWISSYFDFFPDLKQIALKTPTKKQQELLIINYK